ncbi:MAG: biosynthetic-type acetolactate synthase large subunit [Deferribacteraceae bacterium]|jgi:acetolactate synthase-1/2/3 large subunit|nr:biosynthetic-type acetolactate synthase large subunit [Deferribacteraceae bacterium]
MNGADILIASLKREGADTIFGYPGGVLLGLYDRLFDSDIRHILPRHEQGGVHAAEGYAKASGKVGVCMGTSGPGATNLVTGIADAYMDSIPLVVLTGQVASELIGTDAFQEADTIGITRPIVKHSYLVKDSGELSAVVREAFHIAKSGRPGPVVIDLPKNMLNTSIAKAEGVGNGEAQLAGYQPNYEGHPMQIKKLLSALDSAKKPIIIAGGGVRSAGASEYLIKFAEATGIPVLSTFMGLGCIPHDHPLFAGWLGMHGAYAANMSTINADYLMAIGTRFSDRSTGDFAQFAAGAVKAHIDIDPSSISKNIPVNTPIVGDAKVVLEQLLKYISVFKAEKNEKARADWLKQIAKWGREKPFTYEKSDKVIKPQFVVHEIFKLTKGEAIITTEVGQNQMWSAQYYKFKYPNQFISSGGLGTMGFGLPAAIGAKIALADREVFDIAGDDSILMNIQELATAAQHRLGIKVAILNNRFLGMVRQWQQLFFNKRYSHTCMEFQPDFVKLAEAFGCIGLLAEKPDDVKPVLREALKVKDKPVVMDFCCDREENVFPMVPAGAGLDKMIFS